MIMAVSQMFLPRALLSMLNNKVTDAALEEQFKHNYETYIGADIGSESVVNVELVDKVVRKLKRARAAGPDGITAEHLISALMS